MTEGGGDRPSDEYQSGRNPIACAILTRLRARFSYYSAHHGMLLIFLDRWSPSLTATPSKFCTMVRLRLGRTFRTV